MKLLLALAIVFIVIPVMEFAVLIEVGQRIGTIYTLLLVFGAGLLGAWLARMEGLRIVTRIQTDIRAGIMPAEKIVDGVIVLAAGILLLAPGLLSDITGILLLFPPTRYPVRRFVMRQIRRRIDANMLRIRGPVSGVRGPGPDW